MPGRCVASLAVVALCLPVLCSAADGDGDKSLTGYLGAGLMSYPAYKGSARNQDWFAPLPMLDYKDVVSIEPFRAEVRFWSAANDTLTIGIAAVPRFGFQSTDGPRVAGMQTRHDAIEGGLSAGWMPSEWLFTVDYFTDWSDTSDGRSLRFSVYRQLLDDAHWDVGGYVDFDYANRRITQYFFGVQPGEATGTRPAYAPGAAVNSSLGVAGAYKLGKTYALLFGGEMDVLGDAAAESPIVQRRTGFLGYFGVGVIF